MLPPCPLKKNTDCPPPPRADIDSPRRMAIIAPSLSGFLALLLLLLLHSSFTTSCRILIVWLILLGITHAGGSDDDDFFQLVAWMRSHGGRVDDRLLVTQTAVDGIRGGVAVQDIPKGEELLYCPWALVIGSSSLEDQMQKKDMCGVIRAVEAELRLGEDSLWHAYLRLDDSLVNSRLPALWDGAALDELQGLPPADDAVRHIRWFSQVCNGGRSFDDDLDDEVTQQALFSFITRASGVGMVPIYDLLNHHNGKRNAKVRLEDGGVQIFAVEDIAAGSQVYLSYGIKAASTMYRDYGFVEPWPQVWTWVDEASSPGDRYSFVLLQNGVVIINPTERLLKDMVGSMYQPQFQARAVQHTRELSRDSLQQFQAAAHALLDGLPTSAKEDSDILEKMKKSIQQPQQTPSPSARDDAISAVEYRITFKHAVERALAVSEMTLLDNPADREL